MRLRITKYMQGEIDGVSLNRFRVGQTYEVGTRLGSYLLAIRAAVPVIERPTRPIPLDSPERRGKAADGKRSKRKTTRKKR